MPWLKLEYIKDNLTKPCTVFRHHLANNEPKLNEQFKVEYNSSNSGYLVACSTFPVIFDEYHVFHTCLTILRTSNKIKTDTLLAFRHNR